MEYYTFNDKTGKIIDHTGKCVNGLKEIQLSLFDFSSTGCKEQVIEVLTEPVKKDSGYKQELDNSQGPAKDNFVRIPLSQEPVEEVGVDEEEYGDGNPYPSRRR